MSRPRADKPPVLSWPEEKTPASKPGLWDTLNAASDLALLGIAVFVVCLPVVTAGGALAVGSYAASHWCRHRRLPPVSDLLTRVRSALLPGFVAELAALAVAAVLALNLSLIERSVVPGGRVAVVATAVVALWLSAVALNTLLLVGRQPRRGWRDALRRSIRTGVSSPHVVVAPLVVVVVAALLAAMIPLTVPLLVGYGLFAAHVVVDRLQPSLSPGPSRPGT